MEGNKTGASIRSRVLAGILAMVIVAVAGTGILLYYLLHRDMLTRVDESLKRSTREFAGFINNPVSPQTGKPYTDASTFLYDMMQSSVSAPHEGYMATLGTTLKWTAPSNVAVRLEDDPQFLHWAADTDITAEVYLRTVKTDKATYRAVILPAAISGDTQDGRYIVAFNIDAEEADLNSIFVPYIWISCIALALSALVAWFITGRLLRPLSALRNTAASISERDLTSRIDIPAKGDLADLTHAFNSMLDRVENAVESNTQLLDDVGHELRTPLTIMRGHLEVMDSSDPTDVQETRELALDELDRMAGLVDDLIALAKVEDLNPTEFAVVQSADIVERIYLNAQLLAPRVWELENQDSAPILCDKAKIVQAGLQLAENAAKYSAEGATITLGCSMTGDNEPQIYVRDTGRGIPQDELPTLFDRFQRGSNVARISGSGLGLAIVKSIAEAHGARLDVTSSEGEGSCFTITFPSVDETTDATTPLPNSDPKEKHDGTHPHS